jgi:uncharacterized protein (TIGR02145 family)
MKNFINIISSTFIIILFNVACQKQIDYQPQINSLNNNIAALQKSRDSLAAALAQTNNSLNTTNNNVAALSKSLDSIKVQLTSIGTQIASLNAQMALANSNIATLTVQIAVLNQQYIDLLAKYNSIISQLSVTIGTQQWMMTNLDVKTYRDGTVIPQVTDASEWAGLTTGAWCYYNNDAAKGAIYGKLYNWYAVNNTENGGLAPQGWHIPTDAEWTTLGNFLGGNDVAGGKLKEAGTLNWRSPNTNASNESGFSALPGGTRSISGNFLSVLPGGSYGYWWSATEQTSGNAWYRSLGYQSGSLGRSVNLKLGGFSVRCIRD